jgi:hypothetical protein
MWVFELFFSLLGILSFFTIGLTFDYYAISGKQLNFNLAIFFGLGLGLVAVFQMTAALLGVQVNTILIFCITALSIVPIFADPHFKKQLQKSVVENFKKVKGKNVIFLLVFLAFFGLVALVTFSHPAWGFDAIDRWLAKAYSFWFDNGLTRANLHGSYIADDPNLWPIVASWLFHFLGKSSGFWVQLIPFTAIICIVGEFGRRVMRSRLGIGWVAILVFSPFLWETVASASYSGNADMLFSLYFLLVFGAIFEKRLIYAAIFLGFGVLTKNDALPALLGFCVVLPIFKIFGSEKVSMRPIVIAISLLVFNIAWKFYYGLDSRYLENNLALVWQQRPIVAYTKYSINAFREEFRFVAHWGIGFLVIFFFLFSCIKTVFQNKWFLFVLILFVCQFAGYIAVYYVTKEDQATQIATSIFRLVLGVYPALLLFAYELAVFNEKTKG